MDVRQFAFLARQPSAALKNREHFLGLPKRGLAFILANAMFWQPLLAQADGIVVSAPGTTLGQAGNGVPIVNIAAPNAQGLSHNQFSDYNVGANGVILNNATARTQSTQLGGIIVGNPNFNGAAANVILNEVNGGSPSQLRGYTEVAGQSAHVIVANPYGISCNGCGFINTPQVTLTTGKAVIGNGQVTGYQVDQGSVSIDGAGLNASNIDQFEIITRAATLNAQINAKQLTVIAGRNDVDARTLSATARADDGSSKPQVAIDSSALGGMYAGTIKLVGTEAGVGVKLAGNLAASGGDIQLDANGQLNLAQATASGAVNVKAASLDAQGPIYAGSSLNVQTTGDLANRNNLAARDGISLGSGGQLSNTGIIEAGVNADNSRNSAGDVSITAQNIVNSGQSVIASRDLNVTATQTLGNQGGTLSGQRQTSVNAGTLDNQNKGRVLSVGTLGVSAGQLLNSQGGLINSHGTLSANLGVLSNGNAEVSSLSGVSLTVASLDNVAGLITAGSSLNINASGAFNNQGGRLAAQQNLQVNAASLDNSLQGSILSQGSLGLTTRGALDNHQSGQIQSNGMAVINSASLDNQQSGLLSSGNVLSLSSGQVNNSASGRITSAMALTVNTSGLDNHQSGQLSSGNVLSLSSGLVDNSQGGRISSATTLIASVSGLDQHNQGQLSGTTGLTLDLNQGLLNNQNALINTPGALLLKNLATVLNQNGEISSHQGFSLAANSLDNSAGGKVLSDAALSLLLNQTLNNAQGVLSGNSLAIQSASLLNNGGRASGQSALDLTLGSLDNSAGGTLSSQGHLSLSASAALNNRGGQITSVADLSLSGASLDNSQGTLSSNAALNSTLAGQWLNQGGLVSSVGPASLKSLGFDNQFNGRVVSQGGLGLTIGGLLDNRGGSLSAGDSLSLGANRLDNRQGGNLYAHGNLGLTLSDQLLNAQGTLKGDGAILLNAAGLNNDGGQFSSVQGMTLNSLGTLSNLGGSLTSGDTLDLSSGQLNNGAGGSLSSAKALTARVSGLDQQGGKLFSSGALSLDLGNGALNNQNGLINASGLLSLKNLSTVINRSGEISSDLGFTLAAQSLDNSRGKVISQQALLLRIDQVLNNVKGLVSANGLDVRSASLDNRNGTFGSDAGLDLTVLGAVSNLNGVLSSAGQTSLKAASLDNSSGQLTGDLGLSIDLSGALDNHAGNLGSGKALRLSAASLDNRAAGSLLAADGTLSATLTGAFDNRELGKLRAGQAIDLNTGSLDNRGGSLMGKDQLTLHSASADNRGGVIQADKDLKLFVDQLDNRDKGNLIGKAAIGYTGTRLDNSGGLLSAVGPVTLTAQEIANAAGRIASQGDLTANVETLNQQGGALVAQGSLLLTGKTLDNRNGGTLASTGGLTVNVEQVDNRTGELSSTAGSVNVTGQSLNNSDGGKLLSATDLGLSVAQLINQTKGRLFTKGSAHLTGSSLDNTGGNFSGLKGLDIRLDGALLNNTGLLSSEGALTLNAARLDNSAGQIGSGAGLSISSLGALLNQGGSMLTDQGLVLSSASLDNSQQGVINGKGATRVTTGKLDNSQGGHLTSDDSLELTATQVSNGASGRIASEKTLTASVTGLDQQGGELFSKTRLSLDLHNGQLNNQQGVINGPLLVLNNLNGVANQSGEISSAQAYTLAAQSLDNSNGKLLSDQGLSLRVTQGLNNLNGVISAAALDSRSASLDNSRGLISSRGVLDLGVTKAFTNQNGTLIGDGALLLAADSLDNSNGAVSGKTDMTATVASLDNQNGQLIATGALTLNGSTLDNRLNGLVGATKALKLNVDRIDNRAGEISSSADLTLIGSRLDNSDGGKVLSDTVLGLKVAQVINQSLGQLRSQGSATLDGSSLDNSGGTLSAQSGLVITLDNALTNQLQGLISSEGNLTVNAASLDNSTGSLSSAGALRLTSSGALINQGGRLVTDQQLTLNSASLDNTQQGVISAKGAATVSSGTYDNSTGSLNSADSLTLTAGQVTNQGGSIGSEKALSASVSGLDQQGGKLFSHSALSLDLNNGQLNNQNGLINAPSLRLNNLKGVNNQGGEISSAQAFTVLADSLDNSNGKLLSNQAVTLRVNQALSNLKGQIAAAALDVRAASLDNSGGTVTSRGDLSLTTTGQLTNQSLGLINAARTLNVTSGDLNNQGGTLLGTGAVTLNAMALNNTGNGLINSQGGLTITANSLDSSNGGEVSAKGDIGLNLGALTQNGGRLLGSQAISLDLAGGDLDNRNGLLNAQGLLTVSHLRDLNNQNGELSSSQSFNLTGRTLDNSGGKLISNNQLGVSGTSVLNQGGLISGWQGLAVNGGSLDNHSSGTLSSRNGNLDVTLSGGLLNSGNGALVSQKNLTVNAASLDNSAGILSSGAAQQLTVSGLLNNAAGGSIDSATTLTLNAMALNNAGSLSAQQALSFTGTTLDNTSGTLTGNGAVNLDLLGVLTNTNGKLASAGPLVISRSSQINNQGGQLVSQGLLSLLSGGLDNRNRGTVAANDSVTLSAGGAVQNSGDGLIYSQNGDVKLTAASLANGKGTLQGQGALNLTVAGDIDNQSGKLIAQNGDLNVSAANLDNRGGTLASVKAALEARIVGVLKNGYDLNNNHQGGITQAQRLTLSALGGIDNYGGRISAQSGDAVITSADFDNRNGGLYAKGLVQVSGNNFDNSGDNDGQIAGQRIDLSLNGALNNRLGIIESDSTLSVRAASLDNQTGQLRALGTSGKTDLQIAGMFDNRNGKLETANSDLTVNAAGFQNLGGSLLHVGNGIFDIATANILNAGGSLVTRGGLTLTADNWTNSSVIQAGRLTVNVNTLNQTAGGQLLATTSLTGNGGNWNNDGLIASDGTASLSLGGSYGGNGRYSSLGTLGLSAASLNLGSMGSIAGGDSTTINVGGALNNYGRITSAAGMSVSAGSINNYGTLGSNGNLLLSTPSLLNENGLIFSGGDTALQVNSFTNHTAQLYSLGAVSIGGYGGAAQAAQVSNISGSLESTGQFNINAANFENRTESFSLGRKLVSGAIAYNCTKCWGHDYIFSTVVREVYEGQDTDTSASASLSAGSDFVFRGGNFLNSKSTISAGGNISIQADNLKNVGAVGGTIERTRSYQEIELWRGFTVPFFGEVVAYNQRNNPDFPNVYYINGSGGLSLAIPENWRHREGGHDGGTIEEVRFKDSVTGQVVSGVDFSYAYQQIPQSQYDPNNLAPLPDRLQSLVLLSDVEVAKDGAGSGRSAVIQAAGNVSISATQDLTNSVIHQDYGFSAGANKVQGTQVAGTGAPVVVRINAQLPPNLAQQQVNPLTLPGFSLPTGQNGLFRLSGQGGSVRQASQANLASQNWNMGGAAVSTAQRQQSLPEVQARHFQIDAISPVAASDRQLTQTSRLVTGSSVDASVINVTAPVDTGSNVIQLPSYTSSASAITQPGTVQVDAAHQSVAVVVPGVTPTLPVIQRDPLTPVIAPVSVADAATGTSTLARVQGLPDMSVKSNPQKYLVETNPALTDLKQFMSSDYLLSGLGYNPDASAKRLGDGFYEQKLIQQAVVARTGQRFIDGQTSNEKLFKYLMDNAISSKQQLNLSVGVSLTSEQVAALTHDIVWMEKQVVNGEEVLVPVLYLAQATNRLAPNGALIQGTDITLIAGANLENSGTLRASNNLKATAGNDLVNTGLIEAGNRLDLLAGNNIVNKSGGIIAGRDVNMTALTGDVLNQRDVNRSDQTVGFVSTHRESLDNAARIEAANNLSLKAGRDVENNGSVLQSGGDTRIDAGRDIDIAATESRSSTNYYGRGANDSSVTQTGAKVGAGRDLQMTAGRDLTAIASQIDAKRDIAMAATGNLTLSSAAEEQHSYSSSRRVTSQKDHTSQVSTSVTAGGNVAVSAGIDLGLIASKISAGNEAYVYAGKDLNLLSAENTDYSYYSRTKKGSWGRKSTTMTQSETDIAVSSSIDAGKKLVVSAAQDLNTQGAKLATDGDLRASAGHDINLDVAENFSSYATASSKKGMFSSKSSGSSSSQTTVTSTELHGKTLDVQADNDLTLHAAALYAQESAKLSAGRDMEIGTALQQQTSSHYSQSSKFGFNSIGAPNVTQKAQQNQQSSSDSIGTSVSADSLGIKTGRDAVVRGSTLVTDNNLQIDVGRNLAIVSAENTSASSSSSSSKKSGQIGSWWQDAIGVVQLKDGNQSQSTRQAGSQVASLGGDVNLNAAEYYNQIASQVIAPKGDISINAKNVDIQAGYDVLSANHTASSNRTAVGGSIDIPLVDAVRGLQQTAQSSEKTSDPRMQGLAAANAAMSGKQAYEAGQTMMNGGFGFKVSANLSNSQSHTESNQSGQNVVSSSLAAGGDVNVTAAGAGKDSALNVLGSRIDAGHDINLKSDGDINLVSAQNTAVQNSTNDNSGMSIGIGFGIGQQNGFTLELAANKGMGHSDGSDVTQTNTQLKAGNKAALDSGSDTNLKGAVITANQVQANVGGDLNLSSVQDTSKFTSKQIDASVGVSLCIPPFCYGMSSGATASLNQQKMNSDYASVSEQTGIKAGDAGFQIDVKGNTSLNGAVIASTDQAVKDGKNSLSTGTLTTSDIKNKAEYDASSIGLSGGVGGNIGRDAKGNQQAGAPGTPVPSNGNVSANAPIALIASGESSSTTQSGISGASVKINDDSKQQALTGQTAAQAIAAINTDVSSDRDGSNKLKPIFNQQEIQAGFDITAKFVQNVGTYVESKTREADQLRAAADQEKALANVGDPEMQAIHRDNYLSLNQQARDLENDWGAGGTYRQIATALVAGASGGVTGSTAQFAQNMLVNYVQQQGSSYIGKLVAAGLKEGSPEHVALHAILGCAGAAASNQSCSTGAVAGSAASVIAGLFSAPQPDETNQER
ncbi:hemagglutinin repeat-containing protein, partial [Pseudomonas sp. MWU13-2100]|uniref:hemagglutinin repeat-containing protein n=1 Tax=Pseudomonas sp. MWU13-2100 TaxID=2935075 RepID=UPI00200F9799